MSRVLLILSICLPSLMGFTQGNNDCGSAFLIKGSPFDRDSIYANNFPNGMTGNFSAIIDQYYVAGELINYSNSGIGSDDCRGYQDVTSFEFIDVWFKKELPENINSSIPLLIHTSDTVHISFYFGTCDNLFQNRCFTLTPGIHDGRSWGQGGPAISQGKLADKDSLYVQVSFKNPDIYNSILLGFSKIPAGWPLTGASYNATYDRPAIINDLSNVSDLQFSNLTYYPNPFNENIFIDKLNSIYKIEICNAIGQRIFSEKIKQSFININTTNYDKGLYYLKFIKADNTFETVKLLKN